jgi:LPXTG-motif cell wall-anchored protein
MATTASWLAAAAAGAALVLTAAGTAGAATQLHFGIAGTPNATLYPGGSGAIDLLLTNPNDVTLRLQTLTVSLTTIDPAVGAVGACTAADYAITQLPSAAGLVLPPHSSQTLSALGVPAGSLPRIAMLNTSQNQDGCQSAVVNLRYLGDALIDNGGGGGGGGGGGSDHDHDHGGDGHDHDGHDHDHDGDHDHDHAHGDGDSGPTHTGTLPSTGGSHVQDMTAAAAGLILLGTGSVAVIRRRRKS